MRYGNYPDLQNVKKVLVIKLRLHGDVLLSAPFFFHLKRALPQAHLTALVYSETAPMLEGHLDITDYLLYDKGWKKQGFWKRWLKELSFLWKVRRNKYDLVINLTEGDRGAILAGISGARFKVGFDPGNGGFFRKRNIYTHLVRTGHRPRHTVEKHLDVLRRIGIFPDPHPSDLTLHIPEEAHKSLLAFLSSHNLDEGKYVLIHPFSHHLFKTPSPAQISRWIEDLHAEGKKVVLSSGPSVHEKKIMQEILRGVGNTPVVTVWGTFSLKEFAALIACAEALVCVDSLPLHIASALKVPVVVLFGPTSEKMWGPWRHPKAIVLTSNEPCRPCFLDGCGGSKRSECLYKISDKQVIHALLRLLTPEKTPLGKLKIWEALYTR